MVNNNCLVIILSDVFKIKRNFAFKLSIKLYNNSLCFFSCHFFTLRKCFEVDIFLTIVNVATLDNDTARLIQ